jgi:predicted ester cyclase
VLEFVYNGTNTGELMGMPATDRRVSVPMLAIYEIEGGLIRYGRLYYDAATMMGQLGHLDQE